MAARLMFPVTCSGPSRVDSVRQDLHAGALEVNRWTQVTVAIVAATAGVLALAQEAASQAWMASRTTSEGVRCSRSARSVSWRRVCSSRRT